MSTFNKIYKKVANNGDSNDYQVVGQVGVTGVPLDIMKGASSTSDGIIGLVPKPTKGNQNKYLRADGTWQTPPDTNTTYPLVSTTNNGLMSKEDKSRINTLMSEYEYKFKEADVSSFDVKTTMVSFTLNKGGIYLLQGIGDFGWAYDTNMQNLASDVAIYFECQKVDGMDAEDNGITIGNACSRFTRLSTTLIVNTMNITTDSITCDFNFLAGTSRHCIGYVHKIRLI